LPPPTPGAHLAGSPGGGGKGGRGWVIAVVVLVIALVGGGAAFMLLGGDDDKGDDAAPASTHGTDTTDSTATPAPDTSAAEPVDVVRAFFTAGLAGDCPGMADLLTQGSLLAENDTVEAGIAECEQEMADGTSGFDGMTVGHVSLVSVDGDVAIVAVDFDIEGQASTEQFHLQRVDGVWKVDLVASA
jgi:hypothetical protein